MRSVGDHLATDEFYKRVLRAAPSFVRSARQRDVWDQAALDEESRVFLVLLDLWEWLREPDEESRLDE